jgi:hypothetical protein
MPVVEHNNVKIMHWKGTGAISIIEEKKAGNPNWIEIYTKEEVLKLVRNMRDYARQNEGIYFKGQIRTRFGITEKNIDYFKRKFKDVKELFDLLDEIDEICETTAFCGGMKGEYNANLTKLHLTNHFGWKDKTEQDINVSHNLGDFLQKIPKTPKELPEATIQANGVFSLMEEKEEE